MPFLWILDFSSTKSARDQILADDVDCGEVDSGLNPISDSDPLLTSRSLISLTIWLSSIVWTCVANARTIFGSAFQQSDSPGGKVRGGCWIGWGGGGGGWWWIGGWGIDRFLALQVNRLSFFRRLRALANQVETWVRFILVTVASITFSSLVG